MLLPLVAISSLPQDEAGRLSVIFAALTISIGLIRSLVADPYLLYAAADDRPETSDNTKAMLTMAAVAACIAGGVAAVVAFAGGIPGPAALALGALFPGVILQDACRYALFASDRHRAAAGLDAGWLLVFSGLICFDPVRSSASMLLCSWSFAGTMSAIAGIAVIRWRPRMRLASQVARREIATSLRFVVEFTFSVGVPQVLLLLVGVLGTLEEGAAYRLASTLLAPAGIVATGLVAGLQSLAAREARSGSARRVGDVVAVVAPLAVLACWAIIELTPEAIGERLFGAAFSNALPLVRILAVAGILAAAALGVQVTLRARGLLARTLRIRVATGSLALAVAPLAIAVMGAEGAAAVYVVTSALVLAGCMLLAVDSTREGESGLRI